MVAKEFIVKDPYSNEWHEVQINQVDFKYFSFVFIESTTDYTDLRFDSEEAATNAAINEALALFKKAKLARKEFMFGENLKVKVYEERDHWTYSIYSFGDEETITNCAGEEAGYYESEYIAIDKAIAHCISLEYGNV